MSCSAQPRLQIASSPLLPGPLSGRTRTWWWDWAASMVARKEHNVLGKFAGPLDIWQNWHCECMPCHQLLIGAHGFSRWVRVGDCPRWMEVNLCSEFVVLRHSSYLFTVYYHRLSNYAQHCLGPPAVFIQSRWFQRIQCPWSVWIRTIFPTGDGNEMKLWKLAVKPSIILQPVSTRCYGSYTYLCLEEF